MRNPQSFSQFIKTQANCIVRWSFWYSRPDKRTINTFVIFKWTPQIVGWTWLAGMKWYWFLRNSWISTNYTATVFVLFCSCPYLPIPLIRPRYRGICFVSFCVVMKRFVCFDFLTSESFLIFIPPTVHFIIFVCTLMRIPSFHRKITFINKR